MDAIEFTSPWHMARILLRRPHDLSTVRAMVANEFGRAPPIADLTAMREKIDRQQAYAQQRFHGGWYAEGINYSNDGHHYEMQVGSNMLARAICEARL